MKKLGALAVSILFALTLVSLSSVVPQTTRPTTTLRHIQVTAKTIGALPSDKEYLLDLTKRGVKYEFDPKAGAIDFNRIKVRTVRGESAIKTFLEKLFLKDKFAGFKYSSQSFTIGTPPTGPAQRTPTKTLVIACRDLDTCSCTGDDCDDLIRSTLCGDIYFCAHNPVTREIVCTCERRTSS